MFNSAFISVITVLYLAAASWSGDFRGNDWGDSPEDVVSKEGEGSVGETRPPGWGQRTYVNVLSYTKQYSGIPSIIFFCFTKDEEFSSGGYIARNEGSASFWIWEAKLINTYGEPENRDEILTDDESILEIYYSGDALAIEEAVSKGYFSLVRYWENKGTYIWLAAEVGKISGRSVFVWVSYRSKEYFDLYRREEEKGKPPPRRGLPPWYGNPGE